MNNDLEERITNYQTKRINRNQEDLGMPTNGYQSPPIIGDAMFPNHSKNYLESELDDECFLSIQNSDNQSYIFINDENELPRPIDLDPPLNIQGEIEIETLNQPNQARQFPQWPLFYARRMGRIRNGYIKNGENSAERRDNIKRKIKAAITNSILNCINDNFINKEHYGGIKTKKVLEKINRKIVEKISEQDINIWLQKTVAQYFSSPICRKAKTKPDNYNRVQIESIINDNTEKKVIRILNMRIGDMVKIFFLGRDSKDVEEKIFGRFVDMKHFLEDLKMEKGFDENYIGLFKNICKEHFLRNH